MSDASAEASHVQVFIHGDDETPGDFVVDLLHSVFKIPFAKADNLAETTDRYGQALCGTYSREAADELEFPPEKRGRLLVLEDAVHALAAEWQRRR